MHIVYDAELKSGMSRAERREYNCRRCCGKNRKDGSPCQAVAIRPNGRCMWHGALSTGPKTPEGKERTRQALHAGLLRRWEKWRAEKMAEPVKDKPRRPSGPAGWTPEGRARVSAAWKRMHERKRLDKEETAYWDSIYAERRHLAELRREMRQLSDEELLALAGLDGQEAG